MPARKPKSLIVRHETAAEKDARIASENALRPAKGLPMNPPARLRDHQVASAAWRRVMRMYAELEGEIVTRLDYDLLVDYCLLIEQVAELDRMRKTAYQAWQMLGDVYGKLVEDGQAEEAVKLIGKMTDAFDGVVKLDGRVDRKRDLVFKLRQSLYLTPRARAGVAPAKKEKEAPKDELESLLDDVSNFINGPGQ
jgi:phage terminase small subunit